MSHRLIVLIALLLAAFLAFAVAARSEDSNLYPRPASVAGPAIPVLEVYERHCASCHGVTGAGDGPAGAKLHPLPRDFTRGAFKLRSTPTGEPPTPDDLVRTVWRGVAGTAMPSFRGLLTGPELQRLAELVLAFTPVHEDGPGRPITIPPAPPLTLARIDAGRTLYERLDCRGCHGEIGHGDGPLASGLLDDRDHKIRPRDFWEPGALKGGSRVEDVYRTLHTGMDGTPMSSYGPYLSEAQLWDLSYFVLSLQARASRSAPKNAAAWSIASTDR